MNLAMYSLALGQVFLRVIRFSPVSIISPMLLSPISHRRNTTLPMDGLIKQTEQEN